MSFREKSAWVTLITLILLSILFLSHLPWTLRPEPNAGTFHALLLSIGAFIVIEIVAHTIMVVWSPRDARAAKDERELLIELRSTRVAAFAYPILSLGSIFFALHVAGANVIGIGWLVLISFVISEIVKYGMRVFFYRRGF